jgi:hypothetical protein
MSKETLEQIIGRLVMDKEFRQQLRADRARALAAYQLTDEERAALDGLDLTEVASAASLLDERVSKGLENN